MSATYLPVCPNDTDEATIQKVDDFINKNFKSVLIGKDTKYTGDSVELYVPKVIGSKEQGRIFYFFINSEWEETCGIVYAKSQVEAAEKAIKAVLNQSLKSFVKDMWSGAGASIIVLDSAEYDVDTIVDYLDGDWQYYGCFLDDEAIRDGIDYDKDLEWLYDYAESIGLPRDMDDYNDDDDDPFDQF